MNLSKRKVLMNTFFDSQFNYCPLIWMFYSPTKKRKNDRLHERCLKNIYNDKQSLSKELLENNSEMKLFLRTNEMYTLLKCIRSAITFYLPI